MRKYEVPVYLSTLGVYALVQLIWGVSLWWLIVTVGVASFFMEKDL